MKPLPSSLAVLTIALIAAAPPEKKGLPGPTVPDGFGVNIHFTDPQPGEMERFAEGGFKFVRMDLAWQRVERERGRYDFSAYDRLMGHLDEVGARAYFILDYGNPLYDDGLSPHTPAGRAGFAAFARAAASHFKGRGVVWEVWNEPNIGFWKPKPNADDYAKLAVETVRAVREADPEATILVPGSSGFPWDFLETLFATGILKDVDGVSVHPYRASAPETVADDYGRLRALLARGGAGWGMKPIVSGEWGYSTAENHVSEAEQARYIVREYLTNLACGVNLSIFYDWKDDGPDPKENEHRFGTVRQDLAPKPSFLAAKALIDELKGYMFRHRLKGESPADWKLLFSSKEGALAVVSWTTDANAPEAARTPTVRHVKDSDPDAADLKTLASIAFENGPAVESRKTPFIFSAGLAGLDRDSLTVRIAGSVEPLKPNWAVIDGAFTMGFYESPANPYRDRRREIQLEMTYRGRKLPDLAPIQVWRADPLSLALAPRGGAYEAVIDNPSKRPFKGRLVARGPDGKESASVAVEIPEGEAKGSARLKTDARTIDAALVDEKGEAVLKPVVGRFEPIPGPDGGDVLDELEADLHVENSGTGGKPLKASTEDGERVLTIPYEFDPGWRYLVVRPRKPLAIPEKAREALFWLRGDGSGAAVRCRFADASGQTFQPDLGRLDFRGWKLVRVPLDGSAPGGRWGGSGDASPRPPLRWEAFVLLDSPGREKGGRGTAAVASPSYRLDP